MTATAPPEEPVRCAPGLLLVHRWDDKTFDCLDGFGDSVAVVGGRVRAEPCPYGKKRSGWVWLVA